MVKPFLIFLLFPLVSFADALPGVPVSEYADTEASTNIPLVVDFARFDRLAFSLALDASPSNSLEVAVGTDADADGRLCAAETALAFGYDCGTWYELNATNEVVTGEVVSGDGRVGREWLLKRRQIDPSWNVIRIVRRGAGAIAESVKVDERLVRFRVEIR